MDLLPGVIIGGTQLVSPASLPGSTQMLVVDAQGNMSTQSIPSGGVTDHGALTGLGDDDHTQYLPVNGARAMSGLLKLGGTTSVYPALKANSDTIQVRLADDSGYGSIETDWCMVRSTILVGTSNPASYGRLTYASGRYNFLKQDTTFGAVQAGTYYTANWSLQDFGTNSIGIVQGAGVVMQLGANGNGSMWNTPYVQFGPSQYSPYGYMKIDAASTFKLRNAADNGWAQLQTGDVIIDRAAGANAILRFTEAGGLKSQFLSRGSDQSIELLNYDGAGEVRLYQGGEYKLLLGASGVAIGSLLVTKVYTVATLPSASANDGAEARVTDSSVTTYRSTVVGGGSNKVKVFSNGTNWLVN